MPVNHNGVNAIRDGKAVWEPPTIDPLRDAARRALEAMDDLIANTTDPGVEALGARHELQTALIGAPAAVLPVPADRPAILREAADALVAVAGQHPEARAVVIHWGDAAALLRAMAQEECDELEAQAHLDELADDLSRMADEAQQGEPRPDTPRCAHCTHPKGDHSDRKDHTPSPTVPRRPWCHACNATCDYDEQPADEAQQPETQAEDRAAIIAEILPTWEAVYEPGNVSDYLIGYANSEAGAKGAAEAWLRSEKDEPGRLEWVPQTPLDGYDQESELIERHDDGIDTGPGITVRHRTQKPSP